MQLTLSTEATGKGRKVYTDSEVLELSITATALADFARIMNRYTLAKQSNDGEEYDDVYSSAFMIMELLADPIKDFLFDGAPLQREDNQGGGAA
ncbi:hypothetical protein FACS1894141_0510 [Spirochaetia bacterium]|nr:hypothetical protein FACS1894141_0510 [Spirochaetia bacterium]